MFEKNNPVLIATPRTGSTVVCKMLFNIAHHKFGSKAHLNQFLTISPHYKELFDRKDDLIQSVSYQRQKDAFWKEYDDRANITAKRIKLMDNDFKYTTKIFTLDFVPETYIFFKEHFDFVFIERRNKLEQLLSFATMMVTNKHEFKDGESFGPNTYFSFEHALTFFSQQAHYMKIRRMSPNSKVIYYEDFMKLGGNTHALQALLGLPVEDIPETIKIDTIPTPYNSTNLEDLLINKDEWLMHKPTIAKFLEHIV
jgi:hypothetical protein